MMREPPVRTTLRAPAGPRPESFTRGILSALPGGSSSHTPSLEFVRSLIEAGDEVTLHLLLGVFRELRESSEVLRLLLERAEEEGLAWDLLLDRLGNEWGSSSAPGRATSRRALPAGLPSPRERLAPLARWLSSASDVAPLEPLSLFASRPFREVVLEHAPHLTEEQLEQWTAGDLPVLDHLLMNEQLVPEGAEVVCRWAWRKREALQKGAPLGSEQVRQGQARLEGLIQHLAARPEGLAPSFREELLAELERPMSDPAIAACLAPDPTLPAPVLTRLVERAQGERTVVLLCRHPNAERTTLRAVLRKRPSLYASVASALLSPASSERAEQIQALAEDHLQDAHLLLRALAHPAADAATWRLALESTSPTVRAGLAEHRLARQDPEVRQVLLRSRSVNILLPLLCEASPEEYARLIARLFELGHEHATAGFLRHPAPEGTVLPVEVLRFLLSHSSAEVRLAAIRLAGASALRVTEDQPRGLPQGRQGRKRT